jgi:hypothetical protein
MGGVWYAFEDVDTRHMALRRPEIQGGGRSMTQEQYNTLCDIVETLAIKQFADQQAYAQVVRQIFAVYQQNIKLEDAA